MGRGCDIAAGSQGTEVPLLGEPVPRSFSGAGGQGWVLLVPGSRFQVPGSIFHDHRLPITFYSNTTSIEYDQSLFLP
jgi:hypothetical protein